MADVGGRPSAEPPAPPLIFVAVPAVCGGGGGDCTPGPPGAPAGVRVGTHLHVNRCCPMGC